MAQDHRRVGMEPGFESIYSCLKTHSTALKTADSRTGVEDTQDEPGTSCSARK